MRGSGGHSTKSASSIKVIYWEIFGARGEDEWMDDDKWRVENGEWKRDSGEKCLRVVDRGWRVESGGQKMGSEGWIEY